MIKNIVFDMGNVIIRFDRDYFIKRLGVEGDDARLLMREVFCSIEWAQIDRGSLNDAQAYESIRRRIPERLHEAAWKLVSMWERPILPVEGMEELIGELKAAGYGIYLLSNTSQRQHEFWPRVPASRFFDGEIISSDEDVHAVKPQPEIFDAFCRRFSLRKEECLFVDDMNLNVEGAIWYGMPGVVFHGDAELLKKDLRAQGVKI